MSDFFYSCSDCPEHTKTVKMDNKDGPHPLLDYCEEKGRFFSKSFPMRNTPCKAILEKAEHECPVCGEVMDLYYSRKDVYFECPNHGILQEDGTVIPVEIHKTKAITENK